MRDGWGPLIILHSTLIRDFRFQLARAQGDRDPVRHGIPISFDLDQLET